MVMDEATIAERKAILDSLHESQRIRACSPLYGTMASESLSNFMMLCFFSHVVLLIQNRAMLKDPGKSVARWVKRTVTEYFTELWETIKEWRFLNKLELLDRMRFCRKVNESICFF